MDVVRKKRKSLRWLRWTLLFVAVSAGVAATTSGLSSLDKALPEFDRSSVIIDEVQYGTFTRTVRGPGTLVPEEITWVTTDVGGTIVELFVEPGQKMTPETPLLRLHDPQMERSIREAERNRDSAKADVERFLLQQKSQQLDLKVARETARADFEEAREQAELNETLARRSIISQRQWQLSRDKAERNRMLLEVQIEREKNSHETMALQLDERQAAVDRAQDWLDEREEQELALLVLAGTSGVLQQLGSTGGGLEVGQRIAQGTVVARISEPTRLKAVLQVPQTQARDIVRGQPVEVDTRNGIVAGVVSRIDPAVQNDRVAVDVELTGELPRGARPDLSVEGLIEVSRISEALFVRKPAFSREHGRLEVFRLEPGGRTAVRIPVEFGAASSFTIEVTSGLKAGDEIVISETSHWKDFDRVLLK
ncbi:HlyD family efflux transporter periplasmic adaptor subunit [bacterium]|nr:HlyD family efflux transporter periplasmic adaptor subunit [bacterium]